MSNQRSILNVSWITDTVYLVSAIDTHCAATPECSIDSAPRPLTPDQMVGARWLALFVGPDGELVVPPETTLPA